MYRELFSCKDKTAIVTGGSGLIGREIVRGLLQHGARVYILDQDESAAQKLIAEGARFFAFDITDQESVKETLGKVLDETGRIHTLVNCAYPRTKDWGVKFEEVPIDSWNTNVNNHLGGYFLTCKEAAKSMKERGGGSIINLASIYGVVAPDFSVYEGTEMTMPAAYASIKAGIIALTNYLATYYGPYGIRANTVSPGGIFDNQLPSFVQKYSKKTPLGRMGRPGDIVGAVIYLASDASLFVTGHNLIVDGGWTVW